MGGLAMPRKKHTGHTTPTPSTTSEKWTRIHGDARAEVRFSLDDRVAWCGDEVLIGVVIGFTEDAHHVRVRLENGQVTQFPTVSSRLRRVQTPDFDSGTLVEHRPTLVEITPIDEQDPVFDEEDYGEVSVSHREDTIDVSALTMVDSTRRKR